MVIGEDVMFPLLRVIVGMVFNMVGLCGAYNLTKQMLSGTELMVYNTVEELDVQQ